MDWSCFAFGEEVDLVAGWKNGLHPASMSISVLGVEGANSYSTIGTAWAFRKNSDLEITHVWQADDGFQKCKILNKAITASSGDYLVLTDGDCIPRADFVAVHRQQAQPGYYLSGGYFKLPMAISEAITPQDIASGDAFDVDWLVAHGLKNSHKTMKLTARGLKAKLYNAITLTRRTWNGHNASCYKAEAIKVNGFDERMQYGGEDCEFGDRLRNSGLKTKQIRYSAVCLHLDHARGYVNDETWAKNRAIRAKTQENCPDHDGLGLAQPRQPHG